MSNEHKDFDSLGNDFLSEIDNAISKINQMLEKDANFDYWDINSEMIKDDSIFASDSSIENISSNFRRSLSLRVFHKSRMGFGYTESFDNASIRNFISNTIKSLEAMSSIKDGDANDYEIFTDKGIFDHKSIKQKIKLSDVSLPEKIKDISDARRSVGEFEHKTSFRNVYKETLKQKGYFSSNSDHILQDLSYVSFASVASSFGKSVEQGFFKKGFQGGYEISEFFPSVVKKAGDMSSLLQKAIVPKGGKFKVITDPELTEVFIHEALGHASESDIVMNNDSCLKGKMGEKISKDFVNVFDDSTVDGSWGSFFYDDEGIPAQKTPIIKKGILNNFLYSRHTAKVFGKKPTSNGRAQNPSFMPIVRMSNTYLEKGNSDLDDMISDTDGYMLIGSKGGQVDTLTGDFQFNAMYGYKIEKGKLSYPIKGVSLAGNTLKLLKNIESVSKQTGDGMPGFCGKDGQTVPVVGRNPYLLLKDATVGGL